MPITSLIDNTLCQLQVDWQLN